MEDGKLMHNIKMKGSSDINNEESRMKYVTRQTNHSFHPDMTSGENKLKLAI